MSLRAGKPQLDLPEGVKDRPWQFGGHCEDCLFAFICLPPKKRLSGLCNELLILKILFYLFLERGEGREKEKERNISV